MRNILFAILFVTTAFADEITVDASTGRKLISPALYGKNNSLSDSPGSPLKESDWQFLRDAGVRLFRENGGNNSTKYNWELKLSSHPDWYNNVYSHDWDYSAQSLQENIPEAQGMWAFQLIGRVAGSNKFNFNDWGYNGSQWWEGVRNNWAGNGGPDKGDGDPDLYLVDWPPEKTVGILTHWFEELGLDRSKLLYWNMDNEPEVWHGTHDDVMPVAPPVEDYIQVYVQTAKLARAAFPEIKLVGPVFTNEWQWFNWDDDKIQSGGKSYTWIEYFIKRIAEEQQSSGIRLLDVLDLHFYPGESNPEDIVELHRVWFDKTYRYPGANGVKRAGSGGWTDSIREEYILERCRVWLEKYMGSGHGVTFGVSEMGIRDADPNVTAVWYASTLGVFADEGVELFTPWHWSEGMWEVLHLFSNYTLDMRVATASEIEHNVSAYASISDELDALNVMLVNRDLSSAQDITVNLSHFDVPDGDYTLLELADLPGHETYKGKNDNALEQKTVSVSDGYFTTTVPSTSIQAVLLTGKGQTSAVQALPDQLHLALDVYPNPFNPGTTLEFVLPKDQDIHMQVTDIRGRIIQSGRLPGLSAGKQTIQFDGSKLSSGVYLVQLITESGTLKKKLMLLK